MDEIRKLVKQFGMRPVLNMLAAVCREYKENGEPMPWGNPAYDVHDTAEGDDLLTCAANLEDGMY